MPVARVVSSVFLLFSLCVQMVAGHKIPFKDSQSPANTSLKLHSLQNFQLNKMPFIPCILLLIFLVEKGKGENLTVFTILKIDLSSHIAY